MHILHLFIWLFVHTMLSVIDIILYIDIIRFQTYGYT